MRTVCAYLQDQFISIDSDGSLRTSAIRAETTLNSIGRDVDHSKQTSMSLERHLSEIQQVVTSTYNAVSSQSTAVNYLLQSISPSSRYHQIPTEQRFSLPPSAREEYRDKQHLISAWNTFDSTKEQEEGREHKPIIERIHRLVLTLVQGEYLRRSLIVSLKSHKAFSRKHIPLLSDCQPTLSLSSVLMKGFLPQNSMRISTKYPIRNHNGNGAR